MNFVVYLIVCYVSSCFLSLPCVLCITSLAFFLACILCIASLTSSLALYLVRYVSHLVSCFVSGAFRLLPRLLSYVLSGFPFDLSIVDLLVFSLYIISFDKQMYVKLATNYYRYLVWRYRMSCVLRFSPCLSLVGSSALHLLPGLLLIEFLFSFKCSRSPRFFSLHYKS